MTLHAFITPTPTTTHRKEFVFYFYRPILRFVKPIRTLYHEFLRLARARLGVQKCPNVRSFTHSETSFTLEKPSTRCALTPLTDAKQTWGAYSDDDATVKTRERRTTRRDRFDAPARAPSVDDGGDARTRSIGCGGCVDAGRGARPSGASGTSDAPREANGTERRRVMKHG